MGRLVVEVAETDSQQYVKQNIDMLLGRTKTNASILRAANSDVIKAVSVSASNFSDAELKRLWEAIKSVNPQRREFLVPDISPIRQLRNDFSREQALVFDGIRYAGEMADIAYWRLFDLLQELSLAPDTQLTTRQIGVAMLDTWSIVDSVNRLRDLLREAPGVRHETWWELFMRRTKDIDSLRNDIQHQTDKARLQSLIASAGQIWGFLSWAEIRNERYTGSWYLMSPGAVYRNDRWIYAGPPLPAEPLPFGRIRLHAYGREVYLGKIIKAVHDAIAELAQSVQKGSVRAVGTPAVGRNGGDIVQASRIEAVLEDGRTIAILPDIGICH